MKIFFLALMMCISTLSHAGAENALFAGIKWGSTPLEVGNKLKELGFTVPYIKDTAGQPAIKLDKNQAFIAENGRLNGEEAQVAAVFSNNKLLKVIVALLTDDKDAISTYLEMKKLFISKHGEPDTDIARFDSPYYAGDGYERQAIKLGKATIYSVWGSYLTLKITDVLTVTMTYESPEWKAESDRRKEKATSVF